MTVVNRGRLSSLCLKCEVPKISSLVLMVRVPLKQRGLGPGSVFLRSRQPEDEAVLISSICSVFPNTLFLVSGLHRIHVRVIWGFGSMV